MRNSKKLAVIIIIILGILVFSNVLFNGFVFDDYLQIVKPKIVHSPTNFSLFFISSIRDIQKPGLLFNFYYKPFMFTIFSVLYKLGNGNPSPFHLFQIAVHICNVLLLFLLLNRVFNNYLSLFLALIFLVHPVNEETVAYIANLQDILYFFFGSLALVIIQYSKKINSKVIILSSFCLLSSLLSKETGVLFLFIFISYLLIFKKNQFISFLIPLASVITIYISLRMFASQFYFITLLSTPMMNIPFYKRLFYMPKILFFYFREIFFPRVSYTSTIALQVKNIDLQEIILQLFFCAIVIFCFVLLGIIIRRRQKSQLKQYLFFLTWFIVGILFHMQIFPLDTIVAKRWLYFPLAGLLFILGFAIENLPKNKYCKSVLVFASVVLLLLYSLQTITMNEMWKNDKVIQSHTIGF